MRYLGIALGIASLCLFLASNLYFLFQSDWDLHRFLQPHAEIDSIRAELHDAGEKYHLLEGTLQSAQTQLSDAEAQAYNTSEALAAAEAAAAASAVHISGFAYIFYATSDLYACSALVNIARLRNILNSTLAIHILVSEEVSASYLTAMKSLDTTVHLEKVPQPASGTINIGYYRDCMLKLLAFKMHILSPGLKRVLAFDSDQLILRNLDNLFTGLPPVDLAAPRAYWINKSMLASTFLFIDLSDRLWNIVSAAIEGAGAQKFDMDVINDVLGDTVMMLSGEYVTLNSHWEDWGLPTWFRGQEKEGINWTTVDMVNEVARGQHMALGDAAGNRRRRRRALGDLDEQGNPKMVDGTSVQRLGGAPASTLPPPPTEQPYPPVPLGKPFPPANPPPPSIDPPGPNPRFPASHPLTKGLYALKDAAAVVHFTAVSKPWTVGSAGVRNVKLDAHPLLAGLVEEWEEGAKGVCPEWRVGDTTS